MTVGGYTPESHPHLKATESWAKFQAALREAALRTVAERERRAGNRVDDTEYHHHDETTGGT